MIRSSLLQNETKNWLKKLISDHKFAAGEVIPNRVPNEIDQKCLLSMNIFFFVRMRQFLLTLATIDILCSFFKISAQKQ